MNNPNQKDCDEKKPWLCFHCKLAIDGMNKHGFQNQMTAFQQLFEIVSNSTNLKQKNKNDSIEIISTLIKMLGHSGRVDRIVLKTFNNQLRQCLNEEPSALKSWESLKNGIVI